MLAYSKSICKIATAKAGEQESTMIFLRNLKNNVAGATAIEYGLIAALIAVAAITAMSGLGTQLSTTFEAVNTKMVVPAA